MTTPKFNVPAELQAMTVKHGHFMLVEIPGFPGHHDYWMFTDDAGWVSYGYDGARVNISPEERQMQEDAWKQRVLLP